jgi:hypothetical protein
MADNIAVTPGSGATVRTTDIGSGIQVQWSLSPGVPEESTDWADTGVPAEAEPLRFTRHHSSGEPLLAVRERPSNLSTTLLGHGVYSASITPQTYAAGDVIGGRVAHTGFDTTYAVRVRSLMVYDATDTGPDMDIFLGSALGSIADGSALAASAVAPSGVSLANVVRVRSTDWLQVGAAKVAALEPDAYVTGITGTTLYALTVTRTELVVAANTDVVVRAGLELL